MKKLIIIIISSLVFIVFSLYIYVGESYLSMEHSVYVGSASDDCYKENVKWDDKKICMEQVCKSWEEIKPKRLFIFNLIFNDSYDCP